MEPDGDHQSQDLRSFGRRKGRKLSPRQVHLLADLLPRIRVDLANFDFDALASGRDELWLEIGFGGAEHLIAQAERHPSILFIGCEPFEEGVVKALAAIDGKGLSNVRIHADDVRPLLRRLPDVSITRVFILFPDPWPKQRHAKRRLVSPLLLELLARVMRTGAELRMATDVEAYAEAAVLATRADKRFSLASAELSDCLEQPADWIETRYEQKAVRDGRHCYFLRFRRA